MTTQVLCLLGVLAPLVSRLDVPPVPDQPVSRNILIVIADDLGVDKVGAYGFHTPSGLPTAWKTPTIDFLAEQGILFRNAWANPTCSPSRATCLTGQYSFRTGIGRWIRPQDLGLATRFDSIADILPSEFRTAVVGKWHLGGMQGCSPVACTGSYAHGHLSGFETHEGSFFNLIDLGTTGYNSWQEVRSDRFGITVTPKTKYATTETVDDAIRTIQSFDQEPWLVWLAFNAPHHPWHEPPPHLYSGPSLGPDPASNPLGAVKAMTEALDMELNRLIATIDPAVMAETTLIFFSDNGTKGVAQEPPFDIADGKGTLYNSGVNVPFIVCSPLIRKELRGTESTGLVNLTDVFATVAELTGGDSRSGIDSVSLLPYFANPHAPSLREFIFAEKFPINFLPPGLPGEHSVCVRSERFKLIRHAGCPDELYDVLADFHEVKNLMPNGLPSDLGGMPDAAAAYVELRRELDRLCGC